MSFSYRFETVETRQLDRLVSFVRAHNPGYRGYYEWINKMRAEVAAGYKEAIIATSNDKVIGTSIWQPHKALSELAEFKNLRVVENGRSIARFIAKQVEVVYKQGSTDADYTPVITKEDEVTAKLNQETLNQEKHARFQLFYDKIKTG